MNTHETQLSVAQALDDAFARGLARVDAQMLLLHALGRPTHARAWLITHDTDWLTPEQQARWTHLLAQRAAGVPVAYLTGEKAFYGLALQVDARVLDPRPDTETLVDWAVQLLTDASAPQTSDSAPTVLDLGTGSGAIALAIAHAVPQAQVSAVDASGDALAVAHANAQRLGLDVALYQGHWYDALPEPQRFTLIVSNPPYIRDDDPHLPALRHEPPMALTSGPDGLRDIRHIVAQAPRWLHPGGWLLLEHGWDQAEAVRACLTEAGFTAVQSRQDLAGHTRCSGGCLR